MAAAAASSVPAGTEPSAVSETRRSCMCSRAKLASFERRRQLSMLPRPAATPVASATTSASVTHEQPALAQVPERPAQPEAEASHRCLPVEVGDLGPPAGRRPVRDDAAARELDHPVGHARDLAVVGHDQDGRVEFVRLLMQELEDLDARAEVELARRLVRQQDRVAGRERAGDRDPLLLTARQLVLEAVQPPAEADAIEYLRRVGRRGRWRPRRTGRSRARSGPGRG